MKSYSHLKKRWQDLRKDPRIQKAGEWLRRLIVIFILGLIVYQLWDIGWQEVLRSLPWNPLFYLFFLLVYLNLPVAEIFIYKQVWPFRKRDGFKAFLAKKVYNHEVIGYSGEFYLFLWGRKQTQKSDKDIFKNIRDNSILSAVTSNLVAVVLLAVLLYSGHLELSRLIDDPQWIYVPAGVALLAILGAVFYRFREYLFELSRRKTLIVSSIYLTRFLLHHLLLMLMWMAANPAIPWSFWVTFLALFIVVNRIPFLPSKDLVFMWAGIEFARAGDVNLASVAGMLLVYSALYKVANLTVFALLAYAGKDREFDKAMQQEEQKAHMERPDHPERRGHPDRPDHTERPDHS